MSNGQSGRRRGKKHEEEEHENHERWMVSYADMMTLLFVLFVVLFAMSQIDKDKFAALSNGLAEGFGQPMAILDHGAANSDPGLNDPKLSGAMPAPVNIARDAQIDGMAATDEELAAEAKMAREKAARIAAEALGAYESLDEVRRKIDAALTEAGYAGSARYTIDERGLVVSIIADQVLFSAAQADLRPEGRAILGALAPVVRGIPHNLVVEGHANHIPTDPNGRWPSNWELSAYRATTVLRYLAADGGIPQPRMQAAGFAETRPLIPITDADAITVNRRVDVVVLSTASAEANTLLPGLAAADNSIDHPNTAEENHHG